MPAITVTMERRALFEDNRRRLSRAASVASGVAVAVFVVLLFLPRVAPAPPKVVEVEVRQFNLQQVAAMAPPRLETTRPEDQQLNVHSIPDAQLPQGMVNVRRTIEPPLDPDAGKLGRARAEQATPSSPARSRASIARCSGCRRRWPARTVCRTARVRGARPTSTAAARKANSARTRAAPRAAAPPTSAARG